MDVPLSERFGYGGTHNDRSKFKGRSVVDLDGASHALLPEKPQKIEEAVIQFLNDLVAVTDH